MPRTISPALTRFEGFVAACSEAGYPPVLVLKDQRYWDEAIPTLMAHKAADLAGLTISTTEEPVTRARLARPTCSCSGKTETLRLMGGV